MVTRQPTATVTARDRNMTRSFRAYTPAGSRIAARTYVPQAHADGNRGRLLRAAGGRCASHPEPTPGPDAREGRVPASPGRSAARPVPAVQRAGTGVHELGQWPRDPARV